MTRVLILGGGHGGVRCARELIRRRRASDSLDVTLVSRDSVEVWHGLMPQIISSTLQAQHVLVPLREILPGVRVIVGEIRAIDLDGRRVTVAREDDEEETTLDFDVVVLALGSVTDVSRFPGLAEHGLQTKTIGDFVHLRNHLVGLLDQAALETDPDKQSQLLTLVVAGAGFAGVEIAAETAEFLRRAARYYPGLRREDVRVIVLDIVERILPAFNDRLAALARQRLERLGVALRLGVGLAGATATAALLQGGERIPTRTIIVTSGIAPNPLLLDLPVERVRGRVKVDRFCRAPGRPWVYAIGDGAALINEKSGDPLPPMLAVALSQARCAARNIIAGLRDSTLVPCRFAGDTQVALLGPGYGLARLKGLTLQGRAGALASRVRFLGYLQTWRRRLGLLLHWSGTAFFRDDISPLPLGRTGALVPMRFAANDVIVREGEGARRFYVITSGEVEVLQTANGKETLLRRIGPGGTFGELGLMEGGHRTATVRALTDTSVLSIDASDFKLLMQHLPGALPISAERSGR